MGVYAPKKALEVNGQEIYPLTHAKQVVMEDGSRLDEYLKSFSPDSSDTTTEVISEIPAYWETHLTEKIAAIKDLQRSGGKDCYSFVVMADYHRYSNHGKRSPVLIKKIMDECGIKFCLCLGDIQNGGAWKTKELELAEWEEIENEFAPIRDRTLMIPGNHDGAYGSEDINGDGVISGTTDYYVYNLNPDEMYDLIYRKVSLINGVTFDESYNGYYVDDTAAKVRYILVNTHFSDGAVNANGTAVNNYMRKMRIGQSQQNMILEALKSVPGSDWNVVVGSHMPLTVFEGEGGGADLVLLREVLTAYQNKATYSGSFGTAGEYDYVSVNADFTDAKGSVLGAFAGHLHQDLSNTDYAFPIILTSTDAVDSGAAGTVTEQSFDVFTVNKRTGVIHATKIGYGENRVFGGTDEPDDSGTVVNLLENATVAHGSPGSVSGGYLNYYYEAGIGLATLNPLIFYVKAGSTLNVSLSDYSKYLLQVYNYSCDESAKDINFSFTEGESKGFGVPATLIYKSGWQSADISLKIEADSAIGFEFRNQSYTALDDNDKAAIESMLTVTVTTPSTGTDEPDAPAVSYTNLADPTSADWFNGFTVGGVETENSNSRQIVTNYIPVTQYDIVRWKGLDMATNDGALPHINIYDENKEYLNYMHFPANGTNSIDPVITTDENGVTSYEILMRGSTGQQFVYDNYCTRVKYIRFCCCPLTNAEDIIITVNEEIV